jgi:ABC-2 type transport system permease protein
MTLFGLINSFGILSGQNLDFLFNLSPMYHYAQLISGTNSMGWGGSFDTSIKGVFDLGFTLTKWLNEFWVNLVLLIVMPVILFIASFVIFLRKDITV